MEIRNNILITYLQNTEKKKRQEANLSVLEKNPKIYSQKEIKCPPLYYSEATELKSDISWGLLTFSLPSWKQWTVASGLILKSWGKHPLYQLSSCVVVVSVNTPHQPVNYQPPLSAPTSKLRVQQRLWFIASPGVALPLPHSCAPWWVQQPALPVSNICGETSRQFIRRVPSLKSFYHLLSLHYQNFVFGLRQNILTSPTRLVILK